MFLEEFCPTFIILCLRDKGSLTVLTVGPGAPTSPGIQETILCRGHGERRLEWPHGLEINPHTLTKLWEHCIPTSDIHILCK